MYLACRRERRERDQKVQLTFYLKAKASEARGRTKGCSAIIRSSRKRFRNKQQQQQQQEELLYVNKMFRTPSEVMDRLSEVDYEEDYSGVGGDDEYEKKNHNKAETVLAHGETKQVNRLRVVLLSTMLGLMALASFGVYYLVREGEKAEFQSAFAAQGNKLVTGFQGDALRKMQSLESLSSVVTRLALETNATWPLVTFDDSARLLQVCICMYNSWHKWCSFEA